MSAESLPSTPDKSPENNRMATTRHEARELGLQVLFQWDFHGYSSYGLEEFWKNQNVESGVKQFTDQLVDGVLSHYQELDGLISHYAANWSLDRMPVIDRNILRQSIYELLFLSDVPAKVTMNEALQLAKSFADDKTRRFVNGILDQVLKCEPRLQEKRIAAENFHDVTGPNLEPGTGEMSSHD